MTKKKKHEQMTISLCSDLKERIQDAAKMQGLSVSAYIAYIVAEFVDSGKEVPLDENS